jgi:hypothetical protein
VSGPGRTPHWPGYPVIASIGDPGRGHPVRLAKSTEPSRSPRAVWEHAGMSIVPHRVPWPVEVHRAFREELSPSRQSATLSWLSFTVTFVIVRLITHAIRDKNAKEDSDGNRDRHHGGLHNLSIKGVHLHHYLWGILTVSTVAGLSLRVDERIRPHRLMAIAYGIGMALIVDEFALLLDLKDVYWAKQGRTSVDLAITLSAAGATVLAAGPVLSRLRRDWNQASAGPITRTGTEGFSFTKV